MPNRPKKKIKRPQFQQHRYSGKPSKGGNSKLNKAISAPS
jgi:hypothetical protein